MVMHYCLPSLDFFSVFIAFVFFSIVSVIMHQGG